MKLFHYFIFLSILSSTIVNADEIYLKDNTVKKGEIIQVNEKNIEYREINGKPFLTVSRELVSKLKYSDGRIVTIDGKQKNYRILLKSGKVITAKIIKNTPDAIIYRIAGSEKDEAILQEYVKEINLVSKQETAEENPANTIQEYKEEFYFQEGGFIDSNLLIEFIFGCGKLWGELKTKEGSANKLYDDGITDYEVYPDDYKVVLDHYTVQTGLNTRFMLPAKKFKRRSFGLTGIKYGIIGNVLYTNVIQNMEDPALKDLNQYSVILKYMTLNAGPDLSFVFGNRNSFFNFSPHVYLLGGYIPTGSIRAIPCLREMGLSLDASDYKTDFTGYTGTLGTGIRLISNREFPFVGGFDIQYTYSQINLKNALHVYHSNDRKISFNDISVIFSAGLHF